METTTLNVNLKTNKWQIFSVKPYFSKKNGKPTSAMVFLNNPGEHEYTKKIFLTLDKVDELFGKVDMQDLNANLVGIWLEISENVVSVSQA